VVIAFSSFFRWGLPRRSCLVPANDEVGQQFTSLCFFVKNFVFFVVRNNNDLLACEFLYRRNDGNMINFNE
jgi:hypothetical protein